MCELKIYKRIMCHDNEERFKTYTGIELSVQNWLKNLENFDPSTQKSQRFTP